MLRLELPCMTAAVSGSKGRCCMRNRPWQELSIAARGVLVEDGSPAVGVGPLMSCPISQVTFPHDCVTARLLHARVAASSVSLSHKPQPTNMIPGHRTDMALRPWARSWMLTINYGPAITSIKTAGGSIKCTSHLCRSATQRMLTSFCGRPLSFPQTKHQ